MVGDSAGESWGSILHGDGWSLLPLFSSLRTYILPEMPISINPLDNSGLLFAAYSLHDCLGGDHLALQS